jgi:hypothetical protein
MVFESSRVLWLASYGLDTNKGQTRPCQRRVGDSRSTLVRLDRVDRYDRRPPSLRPVAEGQINGKSRHRPHRVIPLTAFYFPL